MKAIKTNLWETKIKLKKIKINRSNETKNN